MGQAAAPFSAGFGLIASHQGAKMEQAGFDLQQSQVNTEAAYNKSLLNVQANRESTAIGRDTRRLISEQRASAARTGLDVNSKSFLALMNESLTIAERDLIQTRNNRKFSEQSLEFKRASEIASLDHQKSVAKHRARVAQVKQVTGLLGTAGTAGTMPGGGA